MFYKRLAGMAVLFVLLAFPVSASMVSFLLVETGLNDDIPSGQYASVWEGGLMDAFFDGGHIVTNSPVARMKDKPKEALSGLVKDDLDEAVNGGAEYFLLGFLDYQVQAGKAIPTGIVLKLYQADSQKLVYEQKFPAGTGKNLDEEYQFAQNAGRIFTSHIEDR